MSVQGQQERGAFLHDAHPCMPVPVEAPLVSFGFPKPTLQSQVLLEAWSCVSTHKESCGNAGHHPSHVVVKRGVEAGELLLQARELGLALRGRTVRTGQRGRDTLDLLHLLTDDVLCYLHLGHPVVETGGSALELGVRTAATVGIEVTLERSTDVSQGLRHAEARWLSRPTLIVIEYAPNGATVIQHDLAGIRRRVGRGGDVLGSLVR